MGCDIHFAVDVRKNGIWQTADKWEGRGPIHEFYGDRNYDLFAILGNVRNGYGFGGIPTGSGFAPMTDQRGIPDDASPEYREWAASWAGDGHSHSFCTIAEIQAYDWTQTTKKQGWVGPRGYCRFKVNGSPDSWSGGVSGPGIQHVSNQDMEDFIARHSKSGKFDKWAFYHEKDEPFSRHGIYTQVHWEIPYYRAGKQFLSEVLPRLWRLGAPEDVRCLFFFDN